jgi:hypothetical protein
MAQDEARTNDTVATIEKPEFASATPASGASAQKKRKKSKDEEEFGYDVDFETPFGKIEFALEPSSVKERKDRERREKAERDAAKAAATAAKKAEKQLRKGNAEQQIVVSGGGSKLVPILLIFLLVASAVALAIWLFARPGEEEQDAVPPEFRNDDAPAEPEPQGFVAKAQQRFRQAVRAGRQASREAQAEQERKFQDLTGHKK